MWYDIWKFITYMYIYKHLSTVQVSGEKTATNVTDKRRSNKTVQKWQVSSWKVYYLFSAPKQRPWNSLEPRLVNIHNPLQKKEYERIFQTQSSMYIGTNSIKIEIISKFVSEMMCLGKINVLHVPKLHERPSVTTHFFMNIFAKHINLSSGSHLCIS